MQFYRYECVIRSAGSLKGSHDSRNREKRSVEEVVELKELDELDELDEEEPTELSDLLSDNAREYTSLFNDNHRREGACFLTSVESPDKATLCIFAKRGADPEELAAGFLGIKCLVPENEKLEEITVEEMVHLIREGHRHSYIERFLNVMEKYGMRPLCSDFGLIFPGKEKMIPETVENAGGGELPAELDNEQLQEEISRIRAGKKADYNGNPVQYLIESDDRETSEKMTEKLLQTLYANGRLKSRRCFIFTNKLKSHEEVRLIHELYKINTDGAVIICLSNEDKDMDSGFVFADPQARFEDICSIVRELHNDVLTIFQMGKSCRKLRSSIVTALGSSGIVEIRDDGFNCGKARKYLTQWARERAVKPDSNLYKEIEENKMYEIPMLKETFEKWYDEKLRFEAYPQYSRIPSALSLINAGEEPNTSGYSELKNMVGLEQQKKLVNEFIAYARMQKLYQSKGIAAPAMTMHMVFTGNPGTAKTTVARIIARIMKEEHILPEGQIIEAGRSDLVSKYVGGTAPKVRRAFQDARGGVLFIDEAYSLVDGKRGLYGYEAINTIVQEMENCGEDTVVIFAGYPEPMEEFLDANPGIRSRIAFYIPFPDYSPEELTEIAGMQAEKFGRTFTPEALEKVRSVMAEARDVKNFGNGRFSRNIVEKAVFSQTRRLSEMNAEKITDEDLRRILPEDVDSFNQETGAVQMRKIGFAS